MGSDLQQPGPDIHVIDTHTGGEPTRVVFGGGPDLGGGTAAEQLELFRADWDNFRSAVVNEPRGSDVMVGALLVAPTNANCCTGVIFFNNVGYLGMCGHGTIGVVAALAYRGAIARGDHRIETPVGEVSAELLEDGRVAVENVASYRYRAGVSVDVPDYGLVTGDVAWGGNWFYLVTSGPEERLELVNTSRLTDVTLRIRDALAKAGVTGAADGYIDHVELFGPPRDAANNSRNFVMCPGGAYDRSPCGTGTSAKLACLAADGKLEAGEVWRQESITGSVFECTYRDAPGGILPRITGSAFVNAESRLILSPSDPLRWGIRA